MSPRSFSTFAKRQKERARQEKQQAKLQRRQQRQADKAAGRLPSDTGEVSPAPAEENQNLDGSQNLEGNPNDN